MGSPLLGTERGNLELSVPQDRIEVNSPGLSYGRPKRSPGGRLAAAERLSLPQKLSTINMIFNSSNDVEDHKCSKASEKEIRRKLS